jgi:WD40 repeat protein/serine/threonine protein kinase/tetratricopeptide (TPR) repeat protein
MSTAHPIDEDLVRRLPLPLAQLYRRAHNAKTALERHLAAYFLWEAALKLLGSVAVVEYAELDSHDPSVTERLGCLARPALGHWWELVRLIVPCLADRGDSSFQAVRDLLLGRTRDDLPRSAGLDALLREVQDGHGGSRATVRLSELFERLLRYRNQELGHGAAGQRPTDFYARMSQALLAATAEFLGRLDLLAGRRLVYVADVRRQKSGAWLVERFELAGEAPRRMESLEVPADAGGLPHTERLYLTPAGRDGALRSLAPLAEYDDGAAEMLFLNARRTKQRIEYLGYTSGQVREVAAPGGACRELLARVLQLPLEAVPAADETAPPPPDEQVPDTATTGPGTAGPPRRLLGEFELLSELGRGGMGVVYRAWQPSLGRQVALKCMLRAGDTKAEARFAREIRALGRVEHPHLVKVFTSGSEGDQWFYVMELVEGADLASVGAHLVGSSVATISGDDWQRALSTACEDARLREKPLIQDWPHPPASPPPAEAPTLEATVRRNADYVLRVADIIRQVADAAQALHDVGVIHRDIKPGNIVLTADGANVVLLDLGLAQLADEAEGRLTRTREFVGTLRYASPEQVLAVGTLDARSDVYSLGVALWEMLTLRPMYGPDEQLPIPELMRRIQYAEPERPRRHNPAVPRDLEAIVLRCLEKDRTRRYAAARDLARDLQRFVAGEPVEARPVGDLERLRRWCRRNPVVSGLAAALAALLIVAAVGSSFAAFRWRRLADDERTARQAAEQSEKEVAAKEQDRARQLARLYAVQGLHRLDDGDALGSLAWFVEALRQEESLAANAELQRIRIGTIVRQFPRLVGLWPHHGQWLQGGHHFVHAGQVSPDGRYIATITGNAAQVWDVRTGSAAGPPLAHQEGVTDLCFSPDGRRLVTADVGGTARVWLVPTGEPAGPALKHRKTLTQACFSPDGLRVLTACRDKTVRVWDASTGQLLLSLDHGDAPSQVSYSPDGRRILTAGPSKDRALRVWDAATGTPVTPWLGMRYRGEEALEYAASLEEVGLKQAGFSSDGRRVFAAGERLAAWDAATGAVVQPPREGAARAAFAPDGGRYVLTRGDTAAVHDASGRELALLTGHSRPITRAAFSPDGRLVVTTGDDQTARLWDAETGERVGPVFLHSREVSGAAFSHDGRFLLTSSFDERLWLWDLAAAMPVAYPLGHRGRVTAASFSPDGRHVVTASSDGTARVWDADTGRPVSPPLAHDAGVLCASFNPDGDRVVTAGADGTARVWDTAGGKPISGPLRHPTAVLHAAFSPDGRQLFTACAAPAPASKELLDVWSPYSWQMVEVATTRGGDARVWDVATGRLAVPPLKDSGPVEYGAFSPDGRRLVTAANVWTLDWVKGVGGFGARQQPRGDLRVWDAATGAPITPPLRFGVPVWAVTWSHDGGHLLASCDRTCRLLDPAAWRPVGQTITQLDPVLCAALSPDGSSVVTGCGYKAFWSFECAARPGEARVWGTAMGKPISPPLRHGSAVYQVAFGREGRWVVTVSGDRRVHVWDVATGELVTPPLVHSGAIVAAVLSPDGHAVHSVTEDGRLWLWDLSPDRRDVEELSLYAPPASGRRLDATRAFQFLDLGDFQGALKQLRLRPASAALLDSPAALAASRQRDELARHAPPRDERPTSPIMLGHYEDPVEAVRAYCQSILFHNVGVLYARKNKWQEAVAAYTKAIELGTADCKTWSGRALAYCQLGQWDKAIADCSRAIELGDRDSFTWNNRGYAYSRLGKWDQAVADYTRAIEISADNQLAWTNRANAYSVLGRWDRAAADYSRVLNLTPKEWWAWRGRGMAYANLGQWDKAATDLTRATELKPDDTTLWRALALSHLAAGHAKSYSRACARMLERVATSTDPDSLAMAAWTCALAPAALPDVQRPLELARKSASIRPDNAASLRALGACLYRAGLHAEAVNRLEGALERPGGRMPAGILFLAMARQQQGQADQARELRQEAARQTGPADWTMRVEVDVLRREAASASEKVAGPQGKGS